MTEKLKKWLDENHMSANELARVSGVPKSTIYDILSGKINPLHVNVSRILAISKVTGVSPEEFFDRPAIVSEPTPERKDLTDDENELLNLWRNATQESRSSVLMVLRCNQRPTKKEAEIS